jgi:hypothetical protein
MFNGKVDAIFVRLELCLNFDVLPQTGKREMHMMSCIRLPNSFHPSKQNQDNSKRKPIKSKKCFQNPQSSNLARTSRLNTSIDKKAVQHIREKLAESCMCDGSSLFMNSNSVGHMLMRDVSISRLN